VAFKNRDGSLNRLPENEAAAEPETKPEATPETFEEVIQSYQRNLLTRSAGHHNRGRMVSWSPWESCANELLASANYTKCAFCQKTALVMVITMPVPGVPARFPALFCWVVGVLVRDDFGRFSGKLLKIRYLCMI
jgi:hypothetical protein